MRNMSLHSHKHSKKGTTLVELVVAMTLTAIFAVACIALIHPIESIYQRTEKTVRAQLLADTVVDSIRKECDDVQYDEEYSVWIASGTFTISSEDDTQLFSKGVELNTDGSGQILVIKRNNNYCEAIYSCLNISDANIQAVKDNAKTGTTTGHAVSRFETDPENRKAGIVHYGYYQAKDSGKGLYPFASYDYTNPVTASTYGDYSVMLEFKNLTYRNDNTKNAKLPAFVECTVNIYDGDIREDGVISKGPIYSRKTAICFSANGSAKGTGSDVYGGEPTHEMKDIKVTVIWDDNHNAQNKRNNISIKLIYDDKEMSHPIPIDEDTYTFKFANIEANNISIKQDPATVTGYKTTILQNSDGSFTVINKVDATNVRLIPGQDFNKLVKNENIVGIRFGSRNDLEKFVPDYDSGYDNVSIDENDNSTSDYRLFIVPDTDDPSKNMAYVISEEGTFIANEKCNEMFMDCTELAIVSDINNVITDNAVDMHRMFMNCVKLREIHVDQWNTANVETFDSMFRNVCCDVEDNIKMTIDISSFSFEKCHYYYDGHNDQMKQVNGINKMFCKDDNVGSTSHIDTIIFPTGHKDMSQLTRLQDVFKGCKNLVNLRNFNDIDFSGLRETSGDQVTYAYQRYDHAISGLFTSCSALKEVDLSNWNCSNITTVDGLLNGLSKAEKLDMSGLDVSSCTSLDGMFKGTGSLLEVDLSGSNFSGIKSLENFLKNKKNDVMEQVNKKLQKIDLDSCDTSSLESVKGMFSGCQYLTKIDMSNFIGSSCTTIESLFEGCQSVTNLEIDGWDTRNVTTMANAFKSCHIATDDDFQLPLGHFKFDKVTDMSGMFNGSGVSKIVFPASGASYSNVLYINGMFQNCKGLTTIEGFEDIKFSKVTDASSMFGGCSKLSSVDFGLDMPKVEQADHMFSNCTGLTTVDLLLNLPQANDITGLFSGCDNLETVVLELKLNKVTSLDGLFSGCSKLRKIDLKANAHSVTSVKNLFYGCTNLTELTTDLKLSKVTEVDNMFNGCSSLEKADLDLDLKNVTSASGLFNGCAKLKTIDMTLNMPLVTNIDSMFKGCSSLETISITSSLINVTSASNLFSGCTKLKTIDANLNLPLVTNLDNMFNGCSSLETVSITSSLTNVTSAANLFSGCTSLKTINANLDMPLVTNFDNMFNGCSSLETITISSQLTSVTSAKNLFCGCAKLTTINADLNMPEVKNIENFFKGCSSLKTINNTISAPAVTIIDGLFADCTSLESINADCDFSGATSAANLFAGCTKLKTISGNIIMPNVTNIDGMFSGCTGLETIPFAIEYQSVTSAKELFSGCTGLKTINKNLNLPLVTNIDYLFKGCSSLETINMNMSFASATSATGLFEGCSSLKTVILDLDLPFISSINYLFKDCSSLTTVNLSGSDFQSCGNNNYFFSNCPLLSNVTMNNVNLSKCTNFDNMFDQCSKLTYVTMQGIHLESAASLGFLPISTITNLDLSGACLNGVTTLKGCFSNATNLVAVNFSGVNLEKCKSTDEMFLVKDNKSKLKTVNFSSVTMNDCETTKKMFDNCVKLEVINMNGFKTPACKDMSYMFEKCHSVTSVDLSGWQTGNVKKMDYMFNEFAVNRSNYRTSTKYITVNISSFSFNKLESCKYMFNAELYSDFVKTIILPSNPDNANAPNLKDAQRMFRKRVHLEGIENLELLATTNKLTDTTSMFSECNMLITIDISSMNLSGVTSTKWMFNAASNQTEDRLTTIYVSEDPSYAFNSSIVTNSDYMFQYRKHLVGQNGTKCDGSNNIDKTYARIDTDETPGYFSVKPAGG